MIEGYVRLRERGNEDVSAYRSEDATVTVAVLDRPQVKNAMNASVAQGLHDVLDYVEESPTRVLILRGAAGTFCSGGDLDAMDDAKSALSFRDEFSILTRLATRFARSNAIIIAAVEGYCLAGGLGLAAASEFVIASDDATFGTPEMNVGLFPMQAMVPILRTTHDKRGLRLLFTGETIDSDEAKDMGLVTEIVPSDRFEDELMTFVDQIASKSPVAIAMGKRAYHTQRDMEYGNALEYLRDCFTLLASGEEAREGITAFRENREPEWSR